MTRTRRRRPATQAPAPGPPEPAEQVRDAALGVDGVLELHGGAFGEVATYLPGRRVVGVRLGAERATVQVTAAYDQPLSALAERVRETVAPLVGTPVDVVVADLRRAGEPTAADPPPPSS